MTAAEIFFDVRLKEWFMRYERGCHCAYHSSSLPQFAVCLSGATGV